jgi:hypothetical protein
MTGSARNAKIYRIEPVYSGGAMIDLILLCSYDVVFDSESSSTHEQGWVRDFSVWGSMNAGQKHQLQLLLTHFIEQMTEHIGPE